MTRRPPARPRPWGRILTTILISCLGLLLCYCSGLWWAIPPLRHAAVHRLTYVDGWAELLVPAWHIPGGAQLAPDGRHMVVGWNGKPVIWDLVMDNRIPLPMDIHDMGWLNARQFVVRSHPNFYIVDAATGTATPVPEVPPETYRKPGGFDVIAPLLQRAEAIYSVQGWGGDRLFIYADEQWSMVVLSAYDFDLASPDAVDALLATIPHMPIRGPGHETPGQAWERLRSPDGQYVARKVGADGHARAVILTRAGTPVAQIYKAGWTPSILGWAHDSSGIYVQFWIAGSAAAARVPDKPLFKLSPLPPAHVRGQVVRRVAPGVAVVLVGGSAGWWWWRRRIAARARAR